MICDETYIETLKYATPEEFERELRRVITDSLQGLVALIDETARRRGHRFRSLVVDDFQVVRTEERAGGFLVSLRYSASAQVEGRGASGIEKIAGSAGAFIDAMGWVTFQGTAFTEDLALAMPDLGGGD
jgi:hypothetical protein